MIDRSSIIVDIGCGTGAATHFIAKSSPLTKVIGIDSDFVLIENAKNVTKEIPLPNLDFEVVVLYH